MRIENMAKIAVNAVKLPKFEAIKGNRGRREREMSEREMSELITQELNNLLSCTQHGFVKGRSTCTNLLEALNDWTYINCTK